MRGSLVLRGGTITRSTLEAMLLPGAVLCLLWVYWPTLAALAAGWARDPRYSHGYLVPLFSLYLLWWRRGQLAKGPLRPSWWGLLPLVLGLAMQVAGTHYYYSGVSAASLLPCLLGLFVLWGGWRALVWSWPAVAF